MTRRERKENRIARRLEWAAGRDKKAAQGFAKADAIASMIPLGQPVLVGHHSERRHRRDLDRIDSGMRQGVESQDMAAHHRSKADGIQHQLDTSIFSDDPDAPERLRERIAGLEADRERMKTINKETKRDDGWEARLAVAGIVLTNREQQVLADVAKFQPYCLKNGRPTFPPYALTNLGGNIRRLKERLAAIEALGRVVEPGAVQEG
jgi:hypothetical protein